MPAALKTGYARRWAVDCENCGRKIRASLWDEHVWDGTCYPELTTAELYKLGWKPDSCYVYRQIKDGPFGNKLGYGSHNRGADFSLEDWKELGF